MTDEENKQLTQEVWMVHNSYGRGYKDAIDEYSNQLWQVIEKCTVNCKLDFNIEDLHNLEIIIKGLAEELKEKNNE